MLKLKLQYSGPPDPKSWLIWKDPGAGKDWGQKEKRETENEMVGWHHWLNGHEHGETLGDCEGQGGLACCSLHRVAKSLTWLEDWATTTYVNKIFTTINLMNISISSHSYNLHVWWEHFRAALSPDLKYTSTDMRKGDGTPFQYSCLENPMDGGAW